MLKSVYGDNVVTLKTVYKWYERFKSGNESVEDEQRSGRPSTSKTDENVQKVAKLVRSDRRMTVRELTEELNISYGEMYEERDQKNGPMASIFITTTRRVTRPF